MAGAVADDEGFHGGGDFFEAVFPAAVRGGGEQEMAEVFAQDFGGGVGVQRFVRVAGVDLFSVGIAGSRRCASWRMTLPSWPRRRSSRLAEEGTRSERVTLAEASSGKRRVREAAPERSAKVSPDPMVPRTAA